MKAKEMNTVSRYDRVALASRYTRNYKLRGNRSLISSIEIAIPLNRESLFEFCDQAFTEHLAHESDRYDRAEIKN